MNNEYNATLNLLTGLIYYELFGLSRLQMLEKAKQHPMYEPMWGDADEDMRDCLSVQALEALSDIEGIMAVRLIHLSVVEGLKGKALMEQIKKDILGYCEYYLSQRGGKIEPIWYESKG